MTNQGIPNVDSVTGISYGVTDARNWNWLFDDVITSGDSISYREWKSQIVDSVRSALSDVVEEFCGSWRKNDDVVDCEEIADTITEHAEWECDEEEYEYSSDGADYLLSYLGGAPLLWICKSKYVTECRGCSPCIPNGGDLDSLGSGFLAYCPPPSEWNAREDAKFEIVEEPREDGLIELKIRELES